MIDFFFSFTVLVFLLVLHWFPGSVLLRQRDAQEALAEMPQREGKPRFSEALAWNREKGSEEPGYAQAQRYLPDLHMG